MSDRERPRIIRRVESAVRRALLGPCGLQEAMDPRAAAPRLLVGVSGGPDSVALLHALVRVGHGRARRAARPRLDLHVAYFDHGLRGPATIDEERAFVAAQAASLGLPFIAGSGDVRAAARRGRLSLEDAARRCRYAFLRTAAAGAGAAVVAVGHTASDQAETVLLRIIRGTGVTGLSAMDWRASWPLGSDGPELIRPLLALRRDETGAYCAALGITPRHDPENDTPRFRRNRIRHELVPLLERYNPRVVEALCGLALSARTAAEVVADATVTAWARVAAEQGEAVTLCRDALHALAPAVRAEVLRRAVCVVSGTGLPPERVHVTALIALAESAGGHLDLPGGVRAESRGDEITIGRTAGEPQPPCRLTGEWLLRTGENELPGWYAFADGVAPARIEDGQPYTAWVRAEVCARGLTVTGRRPGDRIQPLGMSGEKKLQDVLVDGRVPRAERDAVPVVRQGDRIAWVVGVRLAGWAAARAGEPAVRIVFERTP